MMDNSDWTIGNLLAWTTGYLERNGSESPRLDAEVLLAEASGCRRIELYTAFQNTAAEPTRVAYRELVRQRAAGTPVAYLVGHREFYSHSFRVTPDVLIPRPETEFVLVALLDLVKQHRQENGPLEILDVGTGSGILAVCAALHVPDSQITAVDVSPTALNIARLNAEDHGVEERVDLIEGDLFSSLRTGHRFDYIISNPPYIRESEWDNLAPDVREHEPRQALLAGKRGTELIHRLIDEGVKHLKPQGWLITEISPMIADEVLALFEEHPAFGEPRTVKDLIHHPRVVLAARQESSPG